MNRTLAKAGDGCNFRLEQDCACPYAVMAELRDFGLTDAR